MKNGNCGGDGVAKIALQLAREAEIPVLVLDPARKRIKGVNGTFLKTFGWEAEELLGEPYSSFISEEDQQTLHRLLSITAYGGSQEPQNIRLLSPDRGDDVDVSIIGVPNVLEDPTSSVAVLCRPQGKMLGSPIGPPQVFTTDRAGLDRIPPKKRLEDDRRANETSKSLWD